MEPIYAYVMSCTNFIRQVVSEKKSTTFDLSFMYSSVKPVGLLNQYEQEVIFLGFILGPEIPDLMEIYSRDADKWSDYIDFLCIYVCLRCAVK
jgi:hypothetical protein